MEPRSFPFPVILLAAGASSRMRGRDKLMEPIKNMPLIRRQAEMARQATHGTLIITLPPPPHARYAALDGVEATLVPVPDAAEGINASLRAAFANLPEPTQAAMVLLCDLPDLTVNDLRTVAQAVDLGSDTMIWRGATQTKQPGHPIVVAAPLFGLFASLSGDSGGREVLRHASDNISLIALPGNRARNDLDTPEDWNNWHSQNP